MTKRILDVGNCAADHRRIRRLVERHFDTEFVAAASIGEALDHLAESAFDLVLVNRMFDHTGQAGSDLIAQLKGDPRLSAIPVMLVSNLAEAQQQAIAQGALEGFGKASLADAATIEKLSRVLGPQAGGGDSRAS